jgi:hypothetical protein
MAAAQNYAEHVAESLVDGHNYSVLLLYLGRYGESELATIQRIVDILAKKPESETDKAVRRLQRKAVRMRWQQPPNIFWMMAIARATIDAPWVTADDHNPVYLPFHAGNPDVEDAAFSGNP